MTEEKPISFKIFLGVLSITAMVFLAASVLSYFHADKKYSMLLAFFMFVAFAFTTGGIYAGFKFKSIEKNSKTKNLIGLIGNLLIFLFTLGIMLSAALSNANS